MVEASSREQYLKPERPEKHCVVFKRGQGFLKVLANFPMNDHKFLPFLFLPFFKFL